MSKIEEIISKKVKEEYERQLDYLKAVGERSCNELSICYESTLETLKNLELVDATIFDFFEKTNGNIRVIEHSSIFNDYLRVRSDSKGDLLSESNQIRLEPKVKYKIILMVIEEE